MEICGSMPPEPAQNVDLNMCQFGGHQTKVSYSFDGGPIATGGPIGEISTSRPFYALTIPDGDIYIESAKTSTN